MLGHAELPMRVMDGGPNKAIELTGDSACFFAIPKLSSCHPQLIANVRVDGEVTAAIGLWPYR